MTRLTLAAFVNEVLASGALMRFFTTSQIPAVDAFHRNMVAFNVGRETFVLGQFFWPTDDARGSVTVYATGNDRTLLTLPEVRELLHLFQPLLLDREALCRRLSKYVK